MINAQLAGMMQRRVEDGFYPDRANYIIRTVASKDAAGQPVYVETLIPLDCSFNDTPTPEIWGDIEIQGITAEVRFAALTPTKSGLIEIVQRITGEYTNQRFEIVSILDRGPFGCVCALKAVKI